MSFIRKRKNERVEKVNTANSTIDRFLRQIRKDRRKRNRMLMLILTLSLLITVGVFYELRLTALTLANDADCGYTEHVHEEACMEKTLICGQEEAEDGHTHSEECYETSYVCGFGADYEHVHTVDCYSDDSADVETAADWETTVENVELTGSRAEDLLAIAGTQLGYTESTQNWRADEEHNKKGYTRYGAWYGNPYGDWSAMFISFCLNYADIPEDVIPYGAGCYSWSVALEQNEMYMEADGYDPQPGDIVFFDWENDGRADHVGIVERVDEDGIATIEGDVSDSVKNCLYTAEMEETACIIGYCPVGEICRSMQESEELTSSVEEVDSGDARQESGEITPSADEADSGDAGQEREEALPADEADCGYIEHVHEEACIEKTLICGQEESEGGHTHSEECYETSYVCGFDADYEHVHTADCYSDDSADVETAADWEATVENVELTGSWAEDLLAVAGTQLGYAESTQNWRADEDHNKKGYTRYGAWYGDPYGDWSAMFVSFCMNYADIPEDVIPYGADASSWRTALEEMEMYYEADGYDPQPGDIVFFDLENDGEADQAGIVERVDEDGIATIEGDVSDSVKNCLYTAEMEETACIIGYCPVGEICRSMQESGEVILLSEDGDDSASVTYRAQITAEVYLDGSLSSRSFTFDLYDEAGNLVATAQSDSGTVAFPEQTYTEPGLYRYTIRERKDQLGYTYAEDQTVAVVVGGNGLLAQVLTTVGVVGSAPYYLYVRNIDESDYWGYWNLLAPPIKSADNYSWHNYDVVVNPSAECLAELTADHAVIPKPELSQTTDIQKALRRAVYWLWMADYGYQIDLTDYGYQTDGGTTWTKTDADIIDYVHWLTGEETVYNKEKYESLFPVLLRYLDDKGEPDEPFALVLFSSEDGGGASVAGFVLDPDYEVVVTDAAFYNATSSAEKVVDLIAKKTLSGDTLSDGQFTFILTRDGEKVDQASNDADGNVRFRLTNPYMGDYVITELDESADNPGILYDTSEHTYTISLSTDSQTESSSARSEKEWLADALKAESFWANVSGSETEGWEFEIAPYNSDTVYGDFHKAYPFIVTGLDSDIFDERARFQGYCSKVNFEEAWKTAYKISYVSEMYSDEDFLDFVSFYFEDEAWYDDYDGALAKAESNVKRLLYFFEENPDTDMCLECGYQLTAENRRCLFELCLYYSDGMYEDDLLAAYEEILKNVPDTPDGTLMMFRMDIFEGPDAFLGVFIPAGSDADETMTVTYNGRELTEDNQPIFVNIRTFVLPATGGPGLRSYYLIGGTLVAGSLFSAFALCQRRKRRKGKAKG